jgi:DNA/RNA endonuclease YhcR with UshA esterase domain
MLSSLVVRSHPEEVVIMQIAEIASSQLNEIVEIQGRIVSVWDLTKGRKYVLKDGSGQIPVILWGDVLETIEDSDNLRVGAELSLRGRVSEYRGELRVVPAEGTDVQIPSTIDDRSRQSTPLAALSGVGAGAFAWVAGKITSMETFSKGVKLHMVDASGEAVLLLWQNIYDGIPVQEGLAVGAVVGAFGQVNHFRDDWEIVPRSSQEIVVLEKAG